MFNGSSTFYYLFVLFCVSDFCRFYLFLYLYISWFYLVFFGGQDWTSYMLTDCLTSNCKKTFEEYVLTSLLKKHHRTQTSNFSNFLW